MIADATIGLLLDFYDLKRSIGFLKAFFYRKYYSFRRCFDLNKIERVKLYELFYSEREKFLIMCCVQGLSFRLSKMFLREWCI